MVCSACGRENREGARFCDGCGRELTARCTQCAADLRPDARFCDACGNAVEGSPDLLAEARKVVTVVFADLIGSTSLQERMDAESVRHVMGRFYEAMRVVLEQHGGSVQKFIGDAVMCVFGAPSVREDDAERAIRAAAAMVAILPSLNEEIERAWGVRIGMRTGVNTGEVIESAEGFHVGDPVNVAARLEQASSDGEVLVGEQTWRLVRDKITLEPAGDLVLKGKADPVRAYRLVSLSPPTAGTSTPFVGREDELSRLMSAFSRAVADNRAQIANVIGSPGVGKTRLARELAASVGDRALVLEARCEPAGASTFAPIADALRDAASIDEVATDEAVVAALVGLLPSSQSDRERVAARAATVLGAGLPGTPEETFWGVRRIFEALALDRPLVFVLDDVHWAEPMLLDLIEHLADWIRGAPVFVLTLARPDLRESRPSLTEAGVREAVIVLLEGLDHSSSVKLAADLLDADELPTGLTERILESSEGNPLFLRELVRMLVDDGVLRKDNGSWVVTVDTTQVDVPPTIQALLSARIDRLRADERVVIECASVIGKQFYRGAVAALAPVPVANALDRHLETLRRKELVEPEGTYWIDEPIFRFHHVLIRDAAYRRLLKESRADLHERFAAWLEEKAGELVGEHEEVIGYHLEQAHEYRRQLGPLNDDGRRLGERAAAHLGAAGRRAIERDDLAAAAPLLGRALERLDAAHPDRAELLLDRCEALLGMGAVTVGTQALDELRRLSASSPRLQAWVTAFTGELATLTDPSRLRDSAAEVADAATRLAELGDIAGAAKAHDVQARIAARLGQFAACESALDRALAAAREAGDRRRANAVLAGAPVAALWGPSPVARASGRCLDVVRVLRITTGAPAVEATALRCQAVLEALRGREDAARRMLDSSRMTLEELGLRRGLLETDLFAGIVELLAGDPAVAEGYLRPAHDGLRQLGLDIDAALAAALLARACLARGAHEEAEELTLESERLGGDDLKASIAWRAARAEALVKKGALDDALRLARQAVEIAEATDALVDHADARLALASVLAETGHGDEARAETALAVELYERKGATALAARARGGEGEGAVARPTADGARVGFVRVVPGVDPALRGFSERLRVALLENDWNAFARLLHSNAVITDDRAGLRAEVVGREAIVKGISETYGGRQFDVEWEIAASRGRIGVMRMLFFSTGDAVAGPWESERLAVFVLDPVEDILLRGHYVDAADRDTAFALFRSWTTGVRAAPGVDPRHVEWWKPVRAAMVEKNWDAFGSHWHPDTLYADRRPGLQSEVHGRDETVRVIRESFGTREFDYDVELLASRGSAAVALTRFFGLGDTLGGPWEAERLVLTILDDDDAVLRAELFAPDDREAVLAMLGAFGDRTGGVRAALGVDPRHLMLWERFRAALVAKDWEAFASLLDAGLVHADRRPGLQSEVSGRDEYTRVMRESFGTRDIDYDVEIVASRDNAGLTQNLMLGIGDALGGPFEAERLVLYVFDDDRFVRFELFEPVDREAAFARLEELTHPKSAIRSLVTRFVDAYNARDWVTLERLVASDFVLEDHRPLGWGTSTGVAPFLERIQIGVRAAPDARVEAESWLRESGNAGLVRMPMRGRVAGGGGDFELDRLILFVADAGQITLLEIFDLQDERAGMRFDEFSREADDESTRSSTRGQR